MSSFRSAARLGRSTPINLPRITLKRISTARILVADFRPEGRRLITSVLSNIGLRNIDEAHDEGKALSKIVIGKPNILVLDWADPEQSFKLMKTIRRHSFPENEIGVIAVVTNVTASQAARILMSGVNEVVRRPMSPTTLYCRIDKILNGRRAFIKTRAYFGPAPRERRDGDTFFDLVRQSAPAAATQTAAG